MKKEYCIHLQYDVWSCQFWFIGEDDAETQARWEQARSHIPEVLERSTSPQQFSDRTVQLFREYGFLRVHK